MGKTELNFLKLLSILAERIGKPTHSMVVLATLESLGIQDEDARNDYGYRNLYDLAASLFDDLQLSSGGQLFHLTKNSVGMSNAENSIPISDYMWVRVGLFLKNYPQGLFHLMPILLQIVAIVFLGILSGPISVSISSNLLR